ncbi:MAG: hypothetical protein IJZ14_00905 [Oscillospiraceae bacterium]|nr:hypothetical protein [Oscillospiraceae bacterium]
MDLFKEIFIQALRTGEISVSFSGQESPVAEVINGKCFQALQKIKEIIDDDSLADTECFMRIEEIVCALEEIGSNGGSRHDFG